jgi:hypothetical protein
VRLSSGGKLQHSHGAAAHLRSVCRAGRQGIGHFNGAGAERKEDSLLDALNRPTLRLRRVTLRLNGD